MGNGPTFCLLASRPSLKVTKSYQTGLYAVARPISRLRPNDPYYRRFGRLIDTRDPGGPMYQYHTIHAQLNTASLHKCLFGTQKASLPTLAPGDPSYQTAILHSLFFNVTSPKLGSHFPLVVVGAHRLWVLLAALFLEYAMCIIILWCCDLCT